MAAVQSWRLQFRNQEEEAMKNRFEGSDGKRLLIESLNKQNIVEHNGEFAARLAESGELVQFEPNDEIVVQGGTDNDVYFILTGEANVFVNERFVGSRLAGTTIGEMAAIDPAAPRSATVRAKAGLVAFKVSEPKFRGALDEFPSAYRPLAQLISSRLRQRTNFHQPPNPEPVLFVGCSVETLAIAREIQAGMKHDRIDVRVWTDGVFGPSGTSIESLCQVATTSDFAAFVLGPDDRVVSRHEQSEAPRDNVVFELGLFIGKLGRNRVFLVKDQHDDLKIPTDLLGITPISYTVKSAGNLTSAMGSVCNDLRKAVRELGVR
jgi:CRP/FNR family transcriptional regulator, cyclic AMP receptor protein